MEDNQRLWSHTPERMTLSKRVQVEYLVTKVPIQGYSLAVLYPITLFWWRKGAWKKVPYLIITWEVMRKCLIGRLGAGEDDLAEVSYNAPMLSCSGKITGTLPRLRRAGLRAFICLVHAETCRISRVHGRAIPVHGFCLRSPDKSPGRPPPWLFFSYETQTGEISHVIPNFWPTELKKNTFPLF